MSITVTTPRITSRKELVELLAAGIEITVHNAPQHNTKGRHREPTNGTCAIHDVEGRAINVEIRNGYIHRVMP